MLPPPSSSSQADLVINENGGETDSRTISPEPHEVTIDPMESHEQRSEQELSSSKFSNSEETEDGKYKMYKRRWMGMLAIVCLNLSTGLVWLTFNAVSKISEDWFHASLTEVNLSVTLYFFGCIFMSPFSGYVFERWGIKKAVSLVFI
jgi:hypothetical protein